MTPREASNFEEWNRPRPPVIIRPHDRNDFVDNFRIDITGEGDKLLAKAMEIAFTQHSGATHYAVRQACPKGELSWQPARPLRLVFYWSNSEKTPDVVALPFRLDAAGAADFARRWLAEADYGHEPDHDGDNGKGWRLYNEAWGHVDDDWGAIVAVTPVWAMYGK